MRNIKYHLPPSTFTGINRDSNQSNGLISWWPTLVSRGSNSLRDVVGNVTGIFGTNAGASWPIWENQSELGPMVHFNGYGFTRCDYVSMGDYQKVAGLGQMTFSFWAAMSTAQYYPMMVTKSNVFGCAHDEYGYLHTDVWTNTTGQVVIHANGYALSFNTLYNIVLRYDGSALRLYVNGTDFHNYNTAGTGTIATNTNNLYLGGIPGGGDNFHGLLGDVRIYNRALSLPEISQIYNPDTRWELYYPTHQFFSVPSGQVVVDLTVSDFSVSSGIDSTSINADPKLRLSWIQLELPPPAQFNFTLSVNNSSVTSSIDSVTITKSTSLVVNGSYIVPQVDPLTVQIVELASFYPNMDITDGNWTNELGNNINLYASVDETDINDDDYIQSEFNPNNSAVVLKLPDIPDPEISYGHSVYYRYCKAPDGGDLVNLTVQLCQSYLGELEQGTLIAEWVHNDIPDTITSAEQVLTTEQTDSISNYSDLFVRMVAS